METDFDLKSVTNGKRKKDHLDISLNHEVRFKNVTTGLENYHFIHQALPELDLNEIDLSVNVFGKKLRLPLMISPLVGGIEETTKINRNLARVAQYCGIAMGLGSQRAAIEDSNVEKTYHVRDIAPEILLFSNLGAVQLNYGFGFRECIRSIGMTGSDGIILHLNPLQEAFQPEGNNNFKNLYLKIKNICETLDKPVVVREVGFGISYDTAEKLLDCGVDGIDVGGSGGTSWIEVEKIRTKNRILSKVAESFSDWGIPTAESVQMVATAIKKKECKKCRDKNHRLNKYSKWSRGNKKYLIASGGIRNGIEVAKVLALGADLAGIALPFLKNISISIDRCLEYVSEIETGLKIAMFGIGVSNIDELKNTKHMAYGKKG